MKKSIIAILALMVTTSLSFADNTLTETDSQMLFEGKVSKKVTLLTDKEMKDTTGKALNMPEMPTISGVSGIESSIEMPSIDGVVDSGNSIEMPEMPTIGGVGGVSLFGN